jgi:hypothetical protein
MAADILDVLMLTPGPRGRTGLPAILYSPPGCGKTSRVEQVGRDRGFHVETVILSIREPSDVAGLPLIQPDGSVKLAAPAWAKRLAEHGSGGVAFLDELNVSPPALQSAALRVVAEGVVGDFPLPPHVRVIAAANPEDLAAGGWTLTPPLANRLIHLDYEPPSGEAWAEWLSSDGRGPEKATVQLAEETWAREWAAARTSFAAFARRFPQHLLKVPETDTERGRAWPSPRSMELAARAYAGSRSLGAGDGVTLKLLHGAVGEGVGNEAWKYLRDLDLPDPEAVLAGAAEVPMRRSDQTYACLAGVMAVALLDKPNKPERLVRSVEVAAKVAEKSADVAAACLRSVCRSDDFKAGWKTPELGRRLTSAFMGPLAPIAGAMRGEL